MAVKKQGAKTAPAMAFHGESKDGKLSIVGIGNLRVVIVQDDGSWFAQGLEIDYASQGETIEDAKKHFENGLTATVHEHLRIFGSIEKLLKVAPGEVWNDLLMGNFSKSRHFQYYQVSVHKLSKGLQTSLPFEGIQYIEPKKAAAC